MSVRAISAMQKTALGCWILALGEGSNDGAINIIERIVCIFPAKGAFLSNPHDPKGHNKR